MKLFHETITGQHSTGKEWLLIAIQNNDPQTRTANFESYSLSSADVARLSHGLLTNTHLKSLNLLNHFFILADITSLSDAILQNQTLQFLSIEMPTDDSNEIKNTITQIQAHIHQNSTRDEQPSLPSML